MTRWTIFQRSLDYTNLHASCSCCLKHFDLSLTMLHLYNFQTFSQLCTFDYDSKSVVIYQAPWYIQDKPRFAYRGLLLGELQLCQLAILLLLSVWRFHSSVILYRQLSSMVNLHRDYRSSLSPCYYHLCRYIKALLPDRCN